MSQPVGHRPIAARTSGDNSPSRLTTPQMPHTLIHSSKVAAAQIGERLPASQIGSDALSKFGHGVQFSDSRQRQLRSPIRFPSGLPRVVRGTTIAYETLVAKPRVMQLVLSLAPGGTERLVIE